MTGPGETGPETVGRDASGRGAAEPAEEREAARQRDLPRPSETGDVDFASEHSSATFADEVADGPEHARDQDSPSGLAGADPDSA